MRRGLVAGAAGALVVAGVAACGSSGSSYFLASDSKAVLLVEWGQVSGGIASGTITYDDLTGTVPAKSVGVDSTPMTIGFPSSSVRRVGIRDGGAQQGTRRRVAIRPDALYDVFGASRIVGTLSGDTLTLDLPPAASPVLRSLRVLKAVALQQYNSAVGRLQNEVASDNNTAANRQIAAQQARQTAHDDWALNKSVTALQSDVNTLNQEVTRTGSDVTQAGRDLGTLESDEAPSQDSGCDNAYTVNDDAHTVNDDGYTTSDDVSTVVADINDVKAGIKKVQADAKAAYKQGGTVPDDAGTTVSNGRSAMSDATSKVNADVDMVNVDLQTAYSDASSNAGSCGGPGSPTLVNAIPS
jgi:hypothetical protein